MMKMEISFDQNKVRERGFTMEQVRDLLVKAFDEFSFPLVSDGEVMVFSGVGNSKDFGRMLIMMDRLVEAEWFMETASKWDFSRPDHTEDVLSQAILEYRSMGDKHYEQAVA